MIKAAVPFCLNYTAMFWEFKRLSDIICGLYYFHILDFYGIIWLTRFASRKGTPLWRFYRPQLVVILRGGEAMIDATYVQLLLSFALVIIGVVALCKNRD
jgi:hypothetical protein